MTPTPESPEQSRAEHTRPRDERPEPAAARTAPAPGTGSGTRFARVGSARYAVVVALMAVVLILSNIGASKGVEFGPIITDGGFFLFPLAYILGDVVSEVYGFKASRTAIYTSFGLSVFASLCYWVIIALPSASFYEGQEALAATLGPVPQIVVASLLGFLTGQTVNAWIMTAMKKRQGERRLWMRLMGSTGVGELLDTLVFCVIAASVIGITTFAEFMNYFLVGFLYKTLVEYLFVPVTTLVIGWFKRAEPTYGLAESEQTLESLPR
ncbi:queuosine precursor transporter [Arthrobacter sp. UM1]|uniref:queuosine precursor transporter n=1 Tax=Arthrobacter sp. UM1 TaxID=2766776 RepID=UPI001CF6A55D|nr:queuosine precursor transporter [Arthrobacter sp. UM1]MCB4209039.1 queuosine precursor transporter [Arthrobacter sp. UM1]